MKNFAQEITQKNHSAFITNIRNVLTQLYCDSHYRETGAMEISDNFQISTVFHYYPELNKDIFNKDVQDLVFQNIFYIQKKFTGTRILNYTHQAIAEMGYAPTSKFYYSSLKKAYHDQKKLIDTNMTWRTFYASITPAGILLDGYEADQFEYAINETNPIAWRNSVLLPFSTKVEIDGEKHLFSRLKARPKNNIVFNYFVKDIDCYQISKSEKEYRHFIKNIYDDMDLHESRCFYVSHAIRSQFNNHKWMDFGIENPDGFEELSSFMKNGKITDFEKIQEEFDHSLRYYAKDSINKGMAPIFSIRKLKKYALIYQKTFGTNQNIFIKSTPYALMKM